MDRSVRAVFRAVVLAYSEVGYRCLSVLLDRGVEVPLVFTHADAPGEQRWFGSVGELARERGVATVTTEDPHAEHWAARITALAPQYLLCFYYRSMLAAPLLRLPRWGALNMHGSLLPKYRGRAPVNWAIVNGERETGVTLHYMVEKPDAGAIVAQARVPIGIDDTALEVSLAVGAAAARMLEQSLPGLGAGAPAGVPMDLAHGSYFGGRRPEDGRIDWSASAWRIHNLIRAVAPPFPGAFSDLDSTRIVFEGSHWSGEPAHHPQFAPCLYAQEDRLFLDCVDGLRLAVPRVRIGGESLDGAAFGALHGAPLALVPQAMRRKSSR
jgi:methionyl-tRNA formyltransferase